MSVILLYDKYSSCRFTSDEIQSGMFVISLSDKFRCCRFTNNEIASGMLIKSIPDKSMDVVVAIS